MSQFLNNSFLNENTKEILKELADKLAVQIMD